MTLIGIIFMGTILIPVMGLVLLNWYLGVVLILLYYFSVPNWVMITVATIYFFIKIIVKRTIL